MFAALAPDPSRSCFAAWAAEVADAVGVKHVAIDGKTVRGSRAAGRTALHPVSAWAAGAHLTLGQEAVDAWAAGAHLTLGREAVDETSNETTAIPRLLAVRDLTGASVTIDAMGCQRGTAGTIVGRGGDCVLAVEDNQPTRHTEVERRAEAARATESAGASTHGTEERSHGRDELRARGVLTDLSALGERPKWPGLRSVAVAVRDRTAAGRNRCERPYDISRRVMTGKAFRDVIRAHWGIESSPPWAPDVSFGEDRSRVRTDHGPENFALLRRMAVSVLRADTSGGSIRGKRLTAGWNDEFRQTVLLELTAN